MLQVLQTDVAKVDRDVAHVEYVASVSDECFKYLFKMFHLFQTYVASVLIWMLHIFMFQMFHLFLSYFVASVFMLQVVSVLSVCCICCSVYARVASVCSKIFCCFRRMLQVFCQDVVYLGVAIHICCKLMF